MGDNACDDLIKLGMKVDKLTSFSNKNKKEIKKKTMYNIRKRCFLLRTKIKNKVADLHWKTSNYLCCNFKHIFLPTFEVSNMVRKDLPYRSRRINSLSVKMLSLSHGLFKERLCYMANKMGSNVYLCSEHWTSKSCGGCGLIDFKLEGKKEYNCSACGFQLDRDYNGARNIHLKQMEQIR